MSPQVKWLNRVIKVTAIALVMQLFIGVPAFSKDLSTPQIEELKIINTETPGYVPSIYENSVVYVDYRNKDLDIYLYNLITKENICIVNNPKDQMNPMIWGDIVVYQ